MGLFDAIAGIGGSLIGAGSSIYGAQVAADAAKKGGKQQMAMYQQNRADLEPWRQAGVASLADLRDILINGNMDKFKTTPGYDFRMAEGTKAIDRSAAARGSLKSGATLKALNRYGQGVASDEFTNHLNRLFTLSGHGQTATQDTTRLGADAAARSGAYTADAGAIRGTGYGYAGANLGNNLLGLYGYMT